MQKNHNGPYTKGEALLIGIGFGLISGLLASSYIESMKEETKAYEDSIFQSEHPHTYSGRYAIAGEDSNCYLVTDLNIVKYHDMYYLTDKNLKVLGGDVQYSIVEDESLVGKKYQISSNDVIPFQTIFQGHEITLEFAYDLLDYNDIVFPDKFEEITYPLNHNCCEVAFDYVNHMNQKNIRNLYSLNRLYAIYYKGNVYICTKVGMDLFAVVYNGKDYEHQTITFSLSKSSSAHYISVDQVKKVSNLLAQIKIYDNPSKYYNLDQVYYLLSTYFNILDNPFVAREPHSYFDFTKDQVSTVSKQLEVAYQFLDDYQLDLHQSPRYYSVDDLKLVCYQGQYFIAEAVCYSEEEKCYIMYPIHSSNKTSYFSVMDDSRFEVMDFDKIVSKMHFSYLGASAAQYYQLLSDYLIQYGDPFQDFDLTNRQINLEDMNFSVSNTDIDDIELAIQTLGKRLNLKLEYEKNR